MSDGTAPQRRVHFLKIWPDFMKAHLKGVKPWEIRKNDRKFETGDDVVLQEWDPTQQAFTGAWIMGTILYLHVGVLGLLPDYCAFTFRPTLTGADGLPDDLAEMKSLLETAGC